MVCRRVECGARRRRRPAATARRVIYATRNPGRQPRLPAASSAFQLLRRVRSGTHGRERAAHLKDYDELVADIAAGRLPSVTFYKPQGNLNQHPGYASIAEGDAHIADLVAKLHAGPQWSHMVIVITYDEYGGAWDHVAPPRAIYSVPVPAYPALIISPLAKRATRRSHAVRHRLHPAADDPAVRPRDPPGHRTPRRALVAHGEPPMGDLTNALDLRALR